MDAAVQVREVHQVEAPVLVHQVEAQDLARAVHQVEVQVPVVVGVLEGKLFVLSLSIFLQVYLSPSLAILYAFVHT